MDTAIKINPDGTLSYKLHTKKASKQITLHNDSHHPDSTKNAVINSEIRRAMRNSSPDNVEDAIMSVTKKLINNGHPTGMIQHAIHKQKLNKPCRDINKRSDQLVLKFHILTIGFTSR